MFKFVLMLSEVVTKIDLSSNIPDLIRIKQFLLLLYQYIYSKDTKYCPFLLSAAFITDAKSFPKQI
ncbi:hypothetical protein J2769_004101 [Acinetobacter guillouiae]|nr:hypothetical protein [Acinetobacter guillouiae]